MNILDENEFTKIVNNTKVIVLQAVKKHLAAQHYYLIDDIVQEVYFRVYKALIKNKFNEKSKIGTWIYKISVNETYRMINKVNRQNKLIEKYINEKFSSNIQDNEDSPLLGENIDLLPEKYKDVVEMKLLGASEIEIANKLNISIGTVKSRFSRAKQMLKNYLKEGI